MFVVYRWERCIAEYVEYVGNPGWWDSYILGVGVKTWRAKKFGDSHFPQTKSIRDVCAFSMEALQRRWKCSNKKAHLQ